MSLKPLAVLTTVGSRAQARLLASAMVERGLAACAQISEIESFYAWEGTVRNEPEFRLLFKTTAQTYGALEQAIRELHAYELPAIYAIAVDAVHAPYGLWLERHCKRRALPTGAITSPVPILKHGAAKTLKPGGPPGKLVDGARCNVIGGTHAGRSGVVRDIKTGKTGHVSITLVAPDGERFKTLAKNAVVMGKTP